ncbi:hypothetical protein OG225_21275 [Nocardia sp. NBC_01377]|uniref:hypothetical protein n=1 Tax=Nocardia sp. NBC_01377 TaxID=2903595 RepID=UPI0032520618
MLALDGTDPITALRDAINARELDTAADPAAVLDWRLDPTGQHSAGPGPLAWTPGLPTNTDSIDPATLAPVRARQQIVAELATQISDTTRTWTPATAPRWARTLLSAEPELLADLAIWRAGLHIPDTDHRPTGPTRHTAIEAVHQQQLQRRILENDADTRQPQHQWAATVDRIDPRITTDPAWPIIATHIDNAAHTRPDIEQQLTHAAQQRPLPDEMPAAALWARLEIDDTDSTHPPEPQPEPEPRPEPEPGDTAPQPHEPEPTGWDIADAINAAALNNHTEYDHNPDEYDPYDQQLPDTGPEIDW